MEDVRILFTDKVVRTYLGGAYDTVNADKKLRNMMMAEIDYQGFTVRRTSDSALLGLIEIGPYHNGMEQEISYQFVPEVWTGLCERGNPGCARFSFRTGRTAKHRSRNAKEKHSFMQTAGGSGL